MGASRNGTALGSETRRPRLKTGPRPSGNATSRKPSQLRRCPSVVAINQFHTGHAGRRFAAIEAYCASELSRARRTPARTGRPGQRCPKALCPDRDRTLATQPQISVRFMPMNLPLLTRSKLFAKRIYRAEPRSKRPRAVRRPAGGRWEADGFLAACPSCIGLCSTVSSTDPALYGAPIGHTCACAPVGRRGRNRCRHMPWGHHDHAGLPRPPGGGDDPSQIQTPDLRTRVVLSNLPKELILSKFEGHRAPCGMDVQARRSSFDFAQDERFRPGVDSYLGKNANCILCKNTSSRALAHAGAPVQVLALSAQGARLAGDLAAELNEGGCRAWPDH